MLLWRLSSEENARKWDGGYGLLFDGRWNTVGHAVTYCATSPSLCVLEKLVHIEDPRALPPLVMVMYEAPDDIRADSILLANLTDDWKSRESVTQHSGDAWHESKSTPVLIVPSAIISLEDSPDLNVVINNSHPDASKIAIKATEPFALDLRLL